MLLTILAGKVIMLLTAATGNLKQAIQNFEGRFALIAFLNVSKKYPVSI
jgi:hypothetical protein